MDPTCAPAHHRENETREAPQVSTIWALVGLEVGSVPRVSPTHLYQVERGQQLGHLLGLHIHIKGRVVVRALCRRTHALQKSGRAVPRLLLSYPFQMLY